MGSSVSWLQLGSGPSFVSFSFKWEDLLDAGSELGNGNYLCCHEGSVLHLAGTLGWKQHKENVRKPPSSPHSRWAFIVSIPVPGRMSKAFPGLSPWRLKGKKKKSPQYFIQLKFLTTSTPVRKSVYVRLWTVQDGVGDKHSCWGAFSIPSLIWLSLAAADKVHSVL